MHDYGADVELRLTLTKTRHLVVTSKQFVEVSLLICPSVGPFIHRFSSVFLFAQC